MLPVGWAPLVSSGVVAGIGFTVSLLIASLAFHGEQLQEAKVGVLTAALAASLLGWLAFRVVRLLPARWSAGTSERLVDLAVPVDSRRDHVRGSDDAPVTLVEYGDFECPYCGAPAGGTRVVEEFGDDLRYVFRHLPLADVHPHAQLAAEAAEAAAAQGILGDARRAVRPPGRAATDRTWSATRASSASTPTASRKSCAAPSTPRAVPRTSTAAT